MTEPLTVFHHHGLNDSGPVTLDLIQRSANNWLKQFRSQLSQPTQILWIPNVRYLGNRRRWEIRQARRQARTQPRNWRPNRRRRR
jgi:hypothetical protein